MNGFLNRSGRQFPGICFGLLLLIPLAGSRSGAPAPQKKQAAREPANQTPNLQAINKIPEKCRELLEPHLVVEWQPARGICRVAPARGLGIFRWQSDRLYLFDGGLSGSLARAQKPLEIEYGHFFVGSVAKNGALATLPAGNFQTWRVAKNWNALPLKSVNRPRSLYRRLKKAGEKNYSLITVLRLKKTGTWRLLPGARFRVDAAQAPFCRNSSEEPEDEGKPKKKKEGPREFFKRYLWREALLDGEDTTGLPLAGCDAKRILEIPVAASYQWNTEIRKATSLKLTGGNLKLNIWVRYREPGTDKARTLRMFQRDIGLRGTESATVSFQKLIHGPEMAGAVRALEKWYAKNPPTEKDGREVKLRSVARYRPLFTLVLELESIPGPGEETPYLSEVQLSPPVKK